MSVATTGIQLGVRRARAHGTPRYGYIVGADMNELHVLLSRVALSGEYDTANAAGTAAITVRLPARPARINVDV